MGLTLPSRAWRAHHDLLRGVSPILSPVPDRWLDTIQKIKSTGFTEVSFYVDWGHVEGNPGHVSMDGIWSLEQFFDAATQAGIYLIARPGPCINT